MGTFTVPLQVGDLLGRRFIDVEALVDTGASDTMLPANTLTGLGIEPVAWRTFRLADERTVDYQVGQARIRLEGEDCIALVVFGSWKPGKTLLGAVLFAAFDALQIRVQQTPLGADIPYQIFLMAPYILSILALVVMSRRAQVPAALMVPFNKGER